MFEGQVQRSEFTTTGRKSGRCDLDRWLDDRAVDLRRCFYFCARRMIELSTRHQQESELETERLCSAQQQAERLLEIRERTHRQRVKSLEDQVCMCQRFRHTACSVDRIHASC